MMTNQRLIPPTMLYRFSAKCRSINRKWSDTKGINLDQSHQLPCFGQLDGRPLLADVRVGWTNDGLSVNLDVNGKRQSLWCRETQLVESDGLQIWIDTRDTHNVHRANRFCHWFLFLPDGGGSKRDLPIATMLKINRSKEDPKTLNQVKPKVIVSKRVGGYSLNLLIPGKSLTGWDPNEHRKLGFNYLVIDRELGHQSFSIGQEFPIAEDPSLWQTLELVD